MGAPSTFKSPPNEACLYSCSGHPYRKCATAQIVHHPGPAHLCMIQFFRNCQQFVHLDGPAGFYHEQQTLKRNGEGENNPGTEF